jgi:ankyrin repeat protein
MFLISLFLFVAAFFLSLCFSKDRRTALHWAAEKGRLWTVEILLDRGADIIEARDKVRGTQSY